MKFQKKKVSLLYLFKGDNKNLLNETDSKSIKIIKYMTPAKLRVRIPGHLSK